MSDAAQSLNDDEVRSEIQERITPPPVVRLSAAESAKRVSLPIRLPKMYYEALKEYSGWTGQSMNSLAVQAIGDLLREKTRAPRRTKAKSNS